jgi:aspartyl-tRNA(Asn)/glutamyl-tRNA(Gln) amidotransferase subunit A
MRAGELTSLALTRYALDRIAALDPALNAFILVSRERALIDAETADRAFQAGEDKGPLQGIPYALKDNYDVAGMATTCHSKLFLENIPTTDSKVESKLHAGGGVLLGKLSMHEFATSWPSFDLPFPPARNPWNRDHIPGGSSSGAGVAVASGFVRMAMGTDTGGSIRWPAACCGAVGLKPTRGLVSCAGTFPLAQTLDHSGPLAWTVEDAALTLQVVAGYDPSDPASANRPVADFTSEIGQDLQGLRLALPRHLYAEADNASVEIIAAVDETAQKLSALGADIDEVRLPDHALINACGRAILLAESFALHEKNLKTRPLDYARHTYTRIAPGAFISAADYLSARRLQAELETVLNAGVLATHDAIFTASAIALAPRLDAYSLDDGPPTGTQTILANLTGNPALALPIGFSRSGLPIGGQIIGRHFDEATLMRIGAALEAASGPRARPPLFQATPTDSLG